MENKEVIYNSRKVAKGQKHGYYFYFLGGRMAHLIK